MRRACKPQNPFSRNHTPYQHILQTSIHLPKPHSFPGTTSLDDFVTPQHTHFPFQQFPFIKWTMIDFIPSATSCISACFFPASSTYGTPSIPFQHFVSFRHILPQYTLSAILPLATYFPKSTLSAFSLRQKEHNRRHSFQQHPTTIGDLLRWGCM